LVKYPLCYDTLGPADRDAIDAVLDSGRYTMGPRVAEFEKALAEYAHRKYAVMTNSGSSANLIMMAACRYAGIIAEGAEVLVPAVAWSTTYSPIVQQGFRLVLADVDRRTYTMERGRYGPVSAVLAVNLLGAVSDSPIQGALLVDNCEGMGATFAGHPAEYYGVMATTSFFFSHHISTVEGGAVFTNNEKIYHTLLALRAHGWTRDLPGGKHYSDPDDDFWGDYHFVLPGYNVRPTEIAAALGLCQLERLPAKVEWRRSNAEYMAQKLPDWAQLQRQGVGGSWFGLGITLNDDAPPRRDVCRALADGGVEYRPIMTGNFARSPAIKHMPHRIAGTLGGADYIHDRGFMLGNTGASLHRQIDWAVECMEKAYSNGRKGTGDATSHRRR